MKNKVFLIFSLILAICILTVCKQKDKTETTEALKSLFLNHHDSVKYMGVKTCMPCHADKCESFLQTGMGKSFDTASLFKTSANFKNVIPVYDAYLDLHYFPYFKSKKMYLIEYRLKGKDTVHKRLEQIIYIIGSGHHTNSHFTQENGFTFQAPITFYTQQSKWDLPPGFENGHNTRFSRKIGLECMSCHNAIPTLETQSDNQYANLPHGITCERCHGPGQIHVQEKMKGSIIDTSKYADYTIVNPKRLSWQLQIDICQRCHLQGNAVLKPNKQFTDFKPGMVLSEIFDQFSPEYTEGDNFVMAAHAERFQKSLCFIQTEKGSLNSKNNRVGFTCISCHNPHVSVRKTNNIVFNNKCQSCHITSIQKHCTENPKALKIANNDCVKCHMPSSGTADIPHVSVHDHYIRKPAKNKSTDKVKVIKGLKCITNKTPDINTSTEAYISYYEKFSSNKIYLKHAQDSAKKLNVKNIDNLKTLVHLYYVTQSYNQIIELVSRKSVAFNDAWSNYRVAKAFENIKQYESSKTWYNYTLDLQPRNLDFLLQYGALLIKNNQDKNAEEVFNKLNSLYGKNAESWAYLGIIYLKQNNYSAAKRNFDKALALNPDLLLALQNSKIMQTTLNNSNLILALDERIRVIENREKQKKPN
ncbi:MAG: tetratricopeptide repeat protein [Bacteroidetes bacterium]|nr:tetratricopeptide repeat protein [Bacteroidota bacterium]